MIFSDVFDEVPTILEGVRRLVHQGHEPILVQILGPLELSFELHALLKLEGLEETGSHKIDPKAIGVGQYQHDVDQKALKERLDDVVGSCVNNVGVELNTASGELLSYVSGLGPKLANAIVDYRSENGPFATREALKKVPRLGPKAFEQAAGFLRIREGDNPLDASAWSRIISAGSRNLGPRANNRFTGSTSSSPDDTRDTC